MRNRSRLQSGLSEHADIGTLGRSLATLREFDTPDARIANHRGRCWGDDRSRRSDVLHLERVRGRLDSQRLRADVGPTASASSLTGRRSIDAHLSGQTLAAGDRGMGATDRRIADCRSPEIDRWRSSGDTDLAASLIVALKMSRLGRRRIDAPATASRTAELDSGASAWTDYSCGTKFNTRSPRRTTNDGSRFRCDAIVSRSPKSCGVSTAMSP